MSSYMTNIKQMFSGKNDDPAGVLKLNIPQVSNKGIDCATYKLSVKNIKSIIYRLKNIQYCCELCYEKHHKYLPVIASSNICCNVIWNTKYIKKFFNIGNG